MEFQELVRRRRMVRRFQPRPVPREVLLRVLEVARHTPSAGFSQGFDFVVLDEPKQIAWFIQTTAHPDFPEDNPTAEEIPRYSRPDKARFGMQKAEAWPAPYWDIDTGMAVMLILLAAIEDGLGAVFFGITWGEDVLLKELNVPEGCRPIGVVALGYPHASETFDSSRFTARRRRVDSMVHFGGW